MTDPDPRLVHGAVIDGPLLFEVGPASAWMFGGASTLGPSFRFDLSATTEAHLESGAVLPGIAGTLVLAPGRETREAAGRLNRTGAAAYQVQIRLTEPEWDQARELLAQGFRLRRLQIDFDAEVHQWVDIDGYWDDVRYPAVDVDSYRLEWEQTPDAGASAPLR
jgi:hypothetical protein